MSYIQFFRALFFSVLFSCQWRRQHTLYQKHQTPPHHVSTDTACYTFTIWKWNIQSQAWQNTPVTPAIGNQRGEDQKFKIILSYLTSPGLTRATQDHAWHREKQNKLWARDVAQLVESLRSWFQVPALFKAGVLVQHLGVENARWSCKSSPDT